MLQQDNPGDYVIATGETHTVRGFAARAFAHVGLDWARFVKIAPAYYRPAEVEHLHGDATRAKAELGWQPKVLFPELVVRMIDHGLSVLGLTLDEARARVTERFDGDLRGNPGTEPELHPRSGPQPPVVAPGESKDARTRVRSAVFSRRPAGVGRRTPRHGRLGLGGGAAATPTSGAICCARESAAHVATPWAAARNVRDHHRIATLVIY